MSSVPSHHNLGSLLSIIAGQLQRRPHVHESLVWRRAQMINSVALGEAAPRPSVVVNNDTPTTLRYSFDELQQMNNHTAEGSGASTTVHTFTSILSKLREFLEADESAQLEQLMDFSRMDELNQQVQVVFPFFRMDELDRDLVMEFLQMNQVDQLQLINGNSEGQGAPTTGTAVVKLASHVVKNVKDASGDTLICSICLEEMELGDMARSLPTCKHTFHMDCVDIWFTTDRSCPMCRQKILI